MYSAVTFNPAGGGSSSGTAGLAASLVAQAMVVQGSRRHCYLVDHQRRVQPRRYADDHYRQHVVESVQPFSDDGCFKYHDPVLCDSVRNGWVRLCDSFGNSYWYRFDRTVEPGFGYYSKARLYNIVGVLSTSAAGVYGPTQTGQALLAGQSLVGIKTQVGTGGTLYGNGQIPFA